MTDRKQILATLLDDVKKFATLHNSEEEGSADRSTFLERRLLTTIITDGFRQWVQLCAQVPVDRNCAVMAESGNEQRGGDAPSDVGFCEVCNETNQVGDACMTLLSMRVLRRQRENGQNDDDDNDKNDEKEQDEKHTSIADPTIDLVLQCAELFFLPSTSNNSNGHGATALLRLANTNKRSQQVFRTESKWRRFVVTLCERSAPLELSLKGFRCLAGWIASATSVNYSSNNNSQSGIPVVAAPTPTTNILALDALGFLNQNEDDTKSVDEALAAVEQANATQYVQHLQHPAEVLAGSAKLFQNTAASSSTAAGHALLARVTSRALRCSSILHESFSNKSTRSFCRATEFDNILSALFLRHMEGSNSNNNSADFDVLTVASLLTSIAHAVHCCGPASLSPAVAKCLASKYLLLPLAAAQAQSSSSSSLDLNVEVLRPFAFQAVAEIFQRGTAADEDEQTKEKERRVKELNRQLQQQQEQQKEQQQAEEKQLKRDEELSPWSLFQQQQPQEQQQAQQQRETAALHTLIESILCAVNSEILSGSSRDDMEHWQRCVSAIFSSCRGVLLAEDVMLAKQNTKENTATSSSSSLAMFASFDSLIEEFANITRAQLGVANTNSATAARIIGLNAVQSCAVPLSNDFRLALEKRLLVLLEDQSNGAAARLTSNEQLTHLLHVVGRNILSKLLHGNSSGFFAQKVFPLGRGGSGTATSASIVDERVTEAYWCMIDQLVAAIPTMQLQRLLTGNHAAGDEDNAGLVKSFIDEYVTPVLAPMCPSLVSLLSLTSQRELGRELYQRRRTLAAALLRIEQLCVSVTTADSSGSGVGEVSMVCGCSSQMWTKLRESVLLEGS